MGKKVKLSVIMPMYNEENIASNLKELISVLNEFIKDYEIIIVDDGSKNGCFEEAKKFHNKRVKVIGYKKNKGKGYALKYGSEISKGEYVIFFDCGGDLDPRKMKNFLNIMKKENPDIVIGSKRHSESKVYYPTSRRVMSRFYQLVNIILFNLNLTDTQVGLKLFKREVLKKIMPRIIIKRFAFDLELLVIANKMKLKIVEAPVRIDYKFKSSINPKQVFWMLWDTLAVFYRDNILKYYN
jgi:glycosyltransferase involved in cell wall biosynthesis